MPLMSVVILPCCLNVNLLFLSFTWVQWCYCCAGELRFGPNHILSTTGVQQSDPLGPLLFFLVLSDYLSSCSSTDGLLFQLWYLGDGALFGSRPELATFLDSLQYHGPGFGLCPNLSKCEVFRPSGNQGFSSSEFPSTVRQVILSDSSGSVFLGSPVWGPRGVFTALVDSVIERVPILQGRLWDLDNPQVELYLLHSCFGVCKLNHLLHTVSPDSILSQLWLFNSNLCHSLSCICNSCISDQAWLQATLPLSLGDLGLHESSCVLPAAFLGSYVGSQLSRKKNVH